MSNSNSNKLLRLLKFKTHQRNYAQGIWNDFSKRSQSLKVADTDIQQNILGRIDPSIGPASINNYSKKLSYNSPLEIDETFKLAHELLEKESAKIYKKIEESSPSAEDSERLLVNAEKYNPQVLYNSEFLQPHEIDMTQPVYRYLAKQKWQSYDLMLTMQIIETLHVIPDTMPTLDPKTHVKVKFSHNLDMEFSNWITPGALMPAHAVSQPPTIQVCQFEQVDPLKPALYTVLIVNPDTPDLIQNSYSTRLQYGIANIPLTNTNQLIDPALFMNENYTFQDFEPLVPPVNVGNQRACVWVFRQAREVNVDKVLREWFDIREFAASYSLVAVGAHVWRQAYDRSVPQVREMYGMGKGQVFNPVRGTMPRLLKPSLLLESP